MVSANGITLSARHVEAVKNYKKPGNVQEMQRFLGFTNYFRKFIKDYAIKARPLQNLLKKSVECNFDNACNESFELLKNEFTSSPVLKQYDPKAEMELHTDACSYGNPPARTKRQIMGTNCLFQSDDKSGRIKVS